MHRSELPRVAARARRRHTGRSSASAARNATGMWGLFENLSWRESLILVIAVALTVGLRARKAIYKR